MPSGSSSLKATPGASVVAGLSSPELYRLLASLVRRKVPAADAEDVVQATLADALCAQHKPEDETEVRRWVCGIARNKIADYYRAGRREVPHEEPDLDVSADGLPSSAGSSEPHAVRDLLRWAEGALPESDAAQQTFDWMLREGQGEKLESIAAEAKLPAPQVRKRVSRLRQHLKQKWVLELAAVAALGMVVLVAVRIWRPAIDVGPDRTATPKETERALELRRIALQSCASGDFRLCLEGLDRAAAMDPAGEQREEVRRAREIARSALRTESLPAGQGNRDAPTPSANEPSLFRGPSPSPAPSHSQLRKGGFDKGSLGDSVDDEPTTKNRVKGGETPLSSPPKVPAKGDSKTRSRLPQPDKGSSLAQPDKGRSLASSLDGPASTDGTNLFAAKGKGEEGTVAHQAVHAQTSTGYLTVPFPQPEPNYAPQATPVAQNALSRSPSQPAAVLSPAPAKDSDTKTSSTLTTRSNPKAMHQKK